MTVTDTGKRGRRIIYTVVTATGLTLGAFGVAGAATHSSSQTPPAAETRATPDTDNVECDNGLDATGANCDGGPSANQANDPNEPKGAEEADGTEVEGAEEADTDNVECDNGIDAKTGANCDGGPAANRANDPNEPNSNEAD